MEVFKPPLGHDYEAFIANYRSTERYLVECPEDLADRPVRLNLVDLLRIEVVLWLGLFSRWHNNHETIWLTFFPASLLV